eukprot:TRINITY_DN18379_c0_g1_i1.p1 TRINITY_DN18379_c0_g1~~TRINITY_DN18379_c0_g1_i1.p1  ORF type:complete len:643 (+),score=91.51 TRINITY_DN18379_c0_g1_i1:72-2000(+)
MLDSLAHGSRKFDHEMCPGYLTKLLCLLHGLRFARAGGNFLDCSGHDDFVEFRRTLAWRRGTGIVLRRETVRLAWELVQNRGLSRLVPLQLATIGRSTYDQIDIEPPPDTQEYCPLGVLVALHVALADAKRSELHGNVAELRVALLHAYEFLLASVYDSNWNHDGALDFIDSANWTLRSSMDLLVNVQHAYFHDFDTYNASSPAPPVPLHVFRLKLPSLRSADRSGIARISPLVFCTHSALGREVGLVLRMVGCDAPRFVFMENADSTSCKECRAELDSVLLTRDVLLSWKKEELSIPALLQSLRSLFPESLRRSSAPSSSEDLLVCVEPFWLAPLLAVVLGRPVIAHANVAMFLEFPSRMPADVTSWWSLFHTMLGIPGTAMATTSLFLQAQIYEQSNVRFPYVPVVSMHARAVAETVLKPVDAVFFWEAKTAPPAHLTFRAFIRRYAQNFWMDLPEIVFSADKRNTPFQDIASFKALVLLPRQPYEVKLSDAFAMEVPIFSPSEPLAHRFIWSMAQAFSLWAPRSEDMSLLRSRSPWHPSAGEMQPLTSALALGLTLKPDSDIFPRRFWWKWTEWAQLLECGLQGFVSAADLLRQLATLSQEKAARIRLEMHRYQQKRRRRSLSWWKHVTLAAVDAGSQT